MKGIILAGGEGTRLYPATKAISKQLLPIYDKPMIYYPLTLLMQAGLREILIISTPRDLPRFQDLCGDGSQWGIHLQYQMQPAPNGIAAALCLAEDFLAGAPCALILGDNIFYGAGLEAILSRGRTVQNGAYILAHRVQNPQRFGVVQFGANGEGEDIVEKPEKPQSPYAVMGLYFYDATAPKRAQSLSPSARGQLEITDLNRLYLKDKSMRIEKLDASFTWFDAGTEESYADANQFVRICENTKSIKIGCPEEMALRLGFIDKHKLQSLLPAMGASAYAAYLQRLLDKEAF